MSFSENTWKTGDVITADLLNRLEQALALHDTNITGLLSNLGDLTQLSTSSKGNLVAALNEVKGIIPVGGSGGSGSLVYNTLTDLQNAYPNGTTQPVWVVADNAWYYWSGTGTVSAPSDVNSLAASNITSTSLTLSWVDTTANSTSFDVYQNGSLIGNATFTSYSVSGLSASTSYTFKVIAKNSAGSAPGTGSGATTTATTLAAATTPANVTNLATSNISNVSVSLTWTASSGATSYDVYNGSTLLGNTTNTTYQATGLSASTAYTFKVVAKNAAGSASGTTLNVTTLASAPNAVTSLATGTIAPSTVAISWTAPSGGSAVDHYEVAYEASGATSYTVSSNAVNSSSTSFTVTGLHQSTAYTIRVVAIDASGNRSQATTVSVTTIALTASASPSAGTFTSSQTVTLSSNGVAGTNIYYTTDGSAPTTSSTLYSAAITVSATKTIKFFAQNPVGDQSAVQTATYTINLPDTTAPTVTASPAAGTYTGTQTVTLSATDPDNTASQITIYYTTDGTTPTTASTVYTAPISISATTNLQFIGKDYAGNVSTPVAATYTINIDTTPPVDVTGLSVGTPTASTIPVSWTDSTSTDVQYYEVAYSTGGAYTVASGTIAANATSYTITGLSSSTTYTVRVVAIDTSGNRSTGVTATGTTTASYNLFNKNTMVVSGYYINPTGVISASGTSTYAKIPVQPNTQYSLKPIAGIITTSVSAGQRGALDYSSDGTTILSYVDMSTVGYDSTSNWIIFTTPANCNYILLTAQLSGGTDWAQTIQVEKGNTIHNYYQAYSG